VDDLTGLVGIPVRETLQEYMNAAKGGQKTQNDMYKQGMVASGVLSFIGDLKDDDMQEMLDYTQKIGKSQRIIPLPDGWKLTPVNLSLADSQYLETRRYTALQIAAAFGVSPNQLNDYSKGSYSNSVAQEQSFLTGALQFISRVYENQMSLKLLSDDELAAGVHIDMDTDAMLKNTPETMAKILKDMAGGSIMMINEARDMAGLPPIDGGDILVTIPGSGTIKKEGVE
jgi:HK97 family phage portal protein